jgi:hypothetical protein
VTHEDESFYLTLNVATSLLAGVVLLVALWLCRDGLTRLKVFAAPSSARSLAGTPS